MLYPKNVIKAKKNSPYKVLDTIFSKAESRGMPIQHNGNTYHLQLRQLDRTNWLGVRERIKLINPTDDYTIMTDENVPITTTASQVDTWLLQALSYTEALYGARWATKEAIEADPSIDVKNYFETALANILA